MSLAKLLLPHSEVQKIPTGTGLIDVAIVRLCDARFG